MRSQRAKSDLKPPRNIRARKSQARNPARGNIATKRTVQPKQQPRWKANRAYRNIKEVSRTKRRIDNQIKIKKRAIKNFDRDIRTYERKIKRAKNSKEKNKALKRLAETKEKRAKITNDIDQLNKQRAALRQPSDNGRAQQRNTTKPAMKPAPVPKNNSRTQTANKPAPKTNDRAQVAKGTSPTISRPAEIERTSPRVAETRNNPSRRERQREKNNIKRQLKLKEDGVKSLEKKIRQDHQQLRKAETPTERERFQRRLAENERKIAARTREIAELNKRRDALTSGNDGKPNSTRSKPVLSNVGKKTNMPVEQSKMTGQGTRQHIARELEKAKRQLSQVQAGVSNLKNRNSPERGRNEHSPVRSIVNRRRQATTSKATSKLERSQGRVSKREQEKNIDQTGGGKASQREKAKAPERGNGVVSVLGTIMRAEVAEASQGKSRTQPSFTLKKAGPGPSTQRIYLIKPPLKPNKDYAKPIPEKFWNKGSNNPHLKEGEAYKVTGVHPGTDFSVNKNKNVPVLAPSAGKIVEAKSNKKVGNYVVYEFDKYYLVAFHLRDRVPSPSSFGTPKKKGETIGIVGNTGTSSTGIHAHLELWSKTQLQQQGYILNKEKDFLTIRGQILKSEKDVRRYTYDINDLYKENMTRVPWTPRVQPK